MNKFLSFVIILICFRIAESQIDIGEIDCNKHLPSSCKNSVCRGYCSNPCTNVVRTIWGTTTYTYDSTICRAAVHDLRISTWNTSARHVTFEYRYDIAVYVGSKRQSIESADYGKFQNPSDGCYFFKSPRITEEILDIITLHHNYIFEEEHTLECRVASNALGRKIYFSKFSDDEVYEVSPINKESYAYYKKSWRETDGFWCKAERSMLSGVLSHVLEKNSSFIPNEFTITRSVNEKLILNMKQIEQVNYKTWRKNGKDFSGYLKTFLRDPKTNNLAFNSLRIGDAGFYSLDNYYNPDKRAITRLIVRVCKDGMYGSLCEHRCPNCINGGVCHDLTGDCICPPGFNGRCCENACEPGYFGRDCSQQCFNERDEATDCSEILFCLPDPYGCSCISGFSSIYCNESCRFNYYGAGCTQKCRRCKNNETCQPATGKCPNGCEDGWHGTRCELSYPAFKELPTVKNVASNSIALTFREWDKNKDIGVGTPHYYIVQYKNNNTETEWIEEKKITANSISEGQYIVTLNYLSPSTTYDIRVIIEDMTGGVQADKAPIVIASTLCGGYLLFKYTPVVENVTSKSITISFHEWKDPEDVGEGIPDYFIIQYRKYNDKKISKWFEAGKIKAKNSSDEIYCESIKNLTEETAYAIRIIIVDRKGRKQLNNVPIIRVKTLSENTKNSKFQSAIPNSKGINSIPLIAIGILLIIIIILSAFTFVQYRKLQILKNRSNETYVTMQGTKEANSEHTYSNLPNYVFYKR